MKLTSHVLVWGCDRFKHGLLNNLEEYLQYEKVVIPKKQQAKRKREANEAVSSKRAKPNPKPKLQIPKKLVPRAKPNKQATKKRPRASLDVLVPGPSGVPPKRFKLSTSNLSFIHCRR